MPSRFLRHLILLFVPLCVLSQQKGGRDTVYLMNGQIVGSSVIDTTLGAVTISHPKKADRRIHYEFDQLYMVKFGNGKHRFYYHQDSTIGNWYTKREMWMYMKGERDARKGFRGNGSLIGATIFGFIGGASGTIWGPIAPYGFMMLTGIPRVRIRHSTVSDPRYLDSNPYIHGYERVARQRRKIKAVLAGTAGLVAGYAFYFLFNTQYPENLQ
jgi:hypothetical protein